jgi:hypothetical protein
MLGAIRKLRGNAASEPFEIGRERRALPTTDWARRTRDLTRLDWEKPTRDQTEWAILLEFPTLRSQAILNEDLLVEPLRIPVCGRF